MPTTEMIEQCAKYYEQTAAKIEQEDRWEAFRKAAKIAIHRGLMSLPQESGQVKAVKVTQRAVDLADLADKYRASGMTKAKALEAAGIPRHVYDNVKHKAHVIV